MWLHRALYGSLGVAGQTGGLAREQVVRELSDCEAATTSEDYGAQQPLDGAPRSKRKQTYERTTQIIQ